MKAPARSLVFLAALTCGQSHTETLSDDHLKNVEYYSVLPMETKSFQSGGYTSGNDFLDSKNVCRRYISDYALYKRCSNRVRMLSSEICLLPRENNSSIDVLNLRNAYCEISFNLSIDLFNESGEVDARSIQASNRYCHYLEGRRLASDTVEKREKVAQVCEGYRRLKIAEQIEKVSGKAASP